MLSDLRLSLRTLSKARGFALVAVLTLAIGIGASTTMFSALHALVVEPFRYPEPDRLVMVWSGDGWSLSPADSIDIKAQLTSFSSFGVYQPQSFNVGRENAQAVVGVGSTAGVLQSFGVAPLKGRLFVPDDEEKGASPVAIISYRLWQQSFALDPDVVGKPIRLNGRDVTVIGVMPASFEFVGPWMRTSDCQIWTPMSLEEDKEKRDSHWLCGLARLKPGVSVETADAEIKALGRRLTELYPDSNTRKPFLVRSLHVEMTKDLGSQVWMLFGAVALVLVVACANVASMLLARSARRQGEFGLRLALGASQSALVRLALTESFVLALAGMVGGLILAYGGVEVMRAIAPTSQARKAAISLDMLSLAFAFGATLLTTLLAGLPPALAAMRTSLAAVIRSDARGTVGSHARQGMLRALIIAQVAVAFVLANGAALFSASYLKLLEENRNLTTDYVLSIKLNLRGDRYKTDEARVQYWTQLVDRVKALPSVSAAGITSKLPLEGGSNTNALVNAEVYDPTQPRLSVERSSVTFEYFEAMGLPLVKGRNLAEEDRVGDIRGVVVNQEMVKKAWPDKDPIGEIIRGNNPGKPWYTVRVVGVVQNVKQHGATAEVQPEMYLTPEGHWGGGIYLIVRSAQPAVHLTPLIRREVASIDPEVAMEDVRTLRDVVHQATQNQRVVAGLVNFFMASALGLVAVGLYGTLSYHVQQRTREIGVRLATGAVKGDIVRLVFAQGSRWVAVGVVIGLIGTYALSSLLKSLLYRMEGVSIAPLIAAAAVVALAALIACWLPARKASGLDPLEALRAE